MTISDVTTKIGSGATPTGGENAYKKSGIALIRSQNVLDFIFSEHGLVFIDEAQAKKLEGVTVKKDDVLLNITGDSIARCCMAPEKFLPARVNQHVAIIRPKEISPKYLMYYLQYMKPYLMKICGIGGTRNALTKESIENIPFFKQENEEEIATLLSDIDAKIDNNSAIAAELEGMAKDVYDYWFVQFDFPDENGKPYKSSGGKMVWNEELKREIPKGWEVSNLSPFIDIIRGVTYEPEDVSETPKPSYVPLLKSNNIQDGHLLLDNVIYVPSKNVSNDQILKNSSLFITMSSGSTEHVGKVVPITFDTTYCYGAFCSKIAIRPELRCFVSQFFLSNYFKQKIRTIVVGTSIKNISNKHITENLVAIPPKSILKKYEQAGNELMNMQGVITQENQTLASLRDFLLPMLMNGQVKVKERDI